jgi:hypothetical protein
MKAELKTITPAWASMILEQRNANNRALSIPHVENLTREIKSGRWKVNGDTICLNGDRLIDGQHRLTAVIEANMSIQCWVIDGLPSDVFDTKDIGKRRTAADTLSVLGENQTVRLAAMLVIVDKYYTEKSDQFVNYSNTQVEGLLKKYPDARDTIEGSPRHRGIIPQSILDACHYLFNKKDAALANDFVEKITKGTDLRQGDAWYVLRERLMQNSFSKAKLPKLYILALCIKAFNYKRAGVCPVRALRWRQDGNAEKFPKIN